MNDGRTGEEVEQVFGLTVGALSSLMMSPGFKPSRTYLEEKMKAKSSILSYSHQLYFKNFSCEVLSLLVLLIG